MAKVTKLVELLKWSPEFETIKTGLYGEIAYIEWLRHEKVRILTKDPSRTAEIKRENGKAALYVDDVASRWSDTSSPYKTMEI